MAHKKALLGKFYLASSSTTSSDSSSDCRSPIHDGSRWFIPETSMSDEGKKNTQKEEDPDTYNRENQPSTSAAGIQPHFDLQQNQHQQTSEVKERKTEIVLGSNQETNSSSNWKVFPTDNSLVSTSLSNKDTTSSGLTVPFLGTEAHPITASSTSSEGKETTGFNTPPITIPMNTEDSEETIIVTSTPIRSNPPNFRTSNIGTGRNDMPSEIFGSPPSEEIEQEDHNVEPSSSEMNQTMIDSPSSVTSSDKDLNKALTDMRRALTHSQNVRKRKFFAQAIAGE